MLVRVAAAMLLAAGVSAAAAATGLRAQFQQETPGAEPLVIEISEAGDFRVPAHAGTGTLIGVSGTAYLVEERPDGTASVVRLDDLASAVDAVLLPGASARRGSRAGRSIPAQPPGAQRIGSRSVGGIEGELWRLPDGAELVASRAPELAALGKAVESHMGLIAMQVGPALGIRATDMLHAGRMLSGLGALIEQGAFRLIALEPAEIDPARFRLPAEPRSREDMIRELRGEAPGR
ncbi:MAG: hypothetical protein ACK4TG_07260 [Thermaurantiacus sp.]